MANTASVASSRTNRGKPIVLVTGASGFIGRAVIERLSSKYVLVGLDRAGPPNPPASAETVDIDLASRPRPLTRCALALAHGLPP